MVIMQFCAYLYVQNVSLLVVQYVFFYYKLFKKKEDYLRDIQVTLERGKKIQNRNLPAFYDSFLIPWV